MSDSQKLRQLVYDLSTGLCPMKIEKDCMYECMYVKHTRKSERKKECKRDVKVKTWISPMAIIHSYIIITCKII